MSIFYELFEWILSILRIEFEFYGHRISFWNIFAFTLVVDIAGWMVARVINDD